MKASLPADVLAIGTALRAAAGGAHAASTAELLTLAQQRVLVAWLVSLPTKAKKQPGPKKEKKPGAMSHDSWEAVLEEKKEQWRKDFPAIWPRVEEELAKAWDHKSRKSYTHMNLYLGTWLRRANADAVVESARLAKAGALVLTPAEDSAVLPAAPRCGACGERLTIGARLCPACHAPTARGATEQMTEEEKAAGAEAARRLKAMFAGPAVEPTPVLVPEVLPPTKAPRKPETLAEKVARIERSLADAIARGDMTTAEMARRKLQEVQR